MKKSKIKQAKTKLWAAGIVAGVLIVGSIAFKITTAGHDSNVLGTTTVSVTVACDTVCTDLVGQLIDDQTGQPVTPDSNGEFNVTDPNVSVNTTVKGAAQLRVTLTNSAYPAPAGLEIFNQLFTSGDPAYDATGGQMFEILPSSGLANYLQLGRNVLDFYVTSSISSPAQDIHRQIIINYTLPGQPAPEIIDSKLTNNSGNNLPFMSGTTDQVAKSSDLPLHVDLKANNINRAQLTVTDSDGNVSTVYDGPPLAADPATGYATYTINAASGNLPGLHVGRNVITLTVTGLNGQTLSVEWVVYYWPDGVEPPNTGTLRIGGITIAIYDLVLSIGIVLLSIVIAIAIVTKRRNGRNKKTRNVRAKVKSQKVNKKPKRIQIKFC